MADGTAFPRGILMSEAMSFAEITGQYVELLPPRTVLSVVRAGGEGSAAGHGEQGTRGSDGESIPGTTWWALFISYRPGSGYGIGDTSSVHR